MLRFPFALCLVSFFDSTAVGQAPDVGFTRSNGQVAIHVNENSIASYIYADPNILRPYFAHVKTPSGIQVTRNHPPQPDDRDDHATMHPGIWLAFGDLGGNDFWRNKADVRHVRFTKAPSTSGNTGSFTQHKQYIRADGSVVCDEEFRFTVRAEEESNLFIFDSVFSSPNVFYFGDQEEMGLGVRVATAISEVGGGKLTDSEGRKGAKKIWSNAAAWCDYSGEVNGQRVGMTLMCHPKNFRESWFHARDYGLIAANPFGRAAMKKGDASKVIVKPDDKLRLRYAIWIHMGADTESIEAAYNEYANQNR